MLYYIWYIINLFYEKLNIFSRKEKYHITYKKISSLLCSFLVNLTNNVFYGWNLLNYALSERFHCTCTCTSQGFTIIETNFYARGPTNFGSLYITLGDMKIILILLINT